jgi:hypothetical protein
LLPERDVATVGAPGAPARAVPPPRRPSPSRLPEARSPMPRASQDGLEVLPPPAPPRAARCPAGNAGGPSVRPVPPCHGRAGQGSRCTHNFNARQAVAAKQGPPRPLAAYKAGSPPSSRVPGRPPSRHGGLRGELAVSSRSRPN